MEKGIFFNAEEHVVASRGAKIVYKGARSFL